MECAYCKTYFVKKRKDHRFCCYRHELYWWRKYTDKGKKSVKESAKRYAENHKEERNIYQRKMTAERRICIQEWEDVYPNYKKEKYKRQKIKKLTEKKDPIYCQAEKCTNTKKDRRGKYCVVCKIEERNKQSRTYYYGK